MSTEETSTPLLLVGRAGPVTTLTLNRPARRNALNVGLLEQLLGALKAAETDTEQRVVILRAEGPVFCAGLDMTEAADPAVAHRSADLIGQVLEALGNTRLVTIAAVHGAALGGGAGLMTACDLVIAAEGTSIGYPETRRGMVAALVMTFLRRQLRERDARELLLTGEPVDAHRAQEIGLVNRSVAPGELLATAERFAALVLQGGPEAVANTKALFAGMWPRPLAEDLARARAFHMQARQSGEAAEGMTAFREKRRPKWSAGAG